MEETSTFEEYKIYFIAIAIVVVLIIIYFSIGRKEKLTTAVKSELEEKLDALIDKINIKQEV